jgi:hypothetical protein
MVSAPRRSLLKAGAGGLVPAGPILPNALWAAGAKAADSPAPAGRSRFSFALIGDLPYRRFELPAVPQLLSDIAEHCAFAIHVGDIKGGSEPCSDQLLDSRIALFEQSTVPLVYTPGDNEWTDCWRPAAGDHDPAERLAWLRRRVFERTRPWLGPEAMDPWRDLSGPSAGGSNAVGPQRQRDVDGGPPENLMWVAGGVLFLTLNLPGSDNGRRSPQDEADRLERDEHNRRWLRVALARVQRENLAAIGIAVHANPGLGRGIDAAKTIGDDGYAAFRHDLARLNQAFAGHVLLMHGDTHRYRVDRILPRLTRVECFGSPFSSSWVKIDVDTRRHMPFDVSVRNSSVTKEVTP